MRFDGFLRTFGFALCLVHTPQIHARYALDYESHHFQHAKALNITFKSNVTIAHNSSHPAVALQAPKYQNVTVGQAWVYPSSPFDLGARAMSCECFTPTDACCISNTVNQPSSQFCMPGNSTCCGNTFCPPKSTCCGDFCCDLGNACVISPTAGCCPLGKTCLSTVKCYDHTSQQCTGEIKSPYCCSEEAPFCRTEQSHGLACYASSQVALSTTTTSTDTTGFLYFALQTATEPITNNDNPTPSPASLIFPTLNNNIILASSPAVSSSSPLPTPLPPQSSAASPTPKTAPTKPSLCYDPTIGSAKPCHPTSHATTAPFSSAGPPQLHPPFLSVLWGKDGTLGITNATTLAAMVAVMVVVVGCLVTGGAGFDVKDVDEDEHEEGGGFGGGVAAGQESIDEGSEGHNLGLGREIIPVRGSERVLRERVWVDKGDWS